MVLDKYRQSVDPLLTKLAYRLIKINPDIISWFGVICAGIGGFLFYLSSPAQELNNYFLFIAVFFVSLNGLLDALDGKIAKITHKTSLRGDFLDHALDRYADVFLVGGLALSTWIRPSIGLVAIIGMLLTSYMGTQAQAIGYQRVYAGMLGRADRIALLIVFPILQHILLRYLFQFPYNLTVLELMMIYFAVMGNITAMQRFYKTIIWFKKNK